MAGAWVILYQEGLWVPTFCGVWYGRLTAQRVGRYGPDRPSPVSGRLGPSAGGGYGLEVGCASVPPYVHPRKKSERVAGFSPTVVQQISLSQWGGFAKRICASVFANTGEQIRHVKSSVLLAYLPGGRICGVKPNLMQGALCKNVVQTCACP